MRNKLVVECLSILCLLVAATGVMQANAINGSFPFAGFGASENGSNLAVSTLDAASNTLTSGAGLGDFSIVPAMTSYGSFTLSVPTIGSGGGFSISNATYGAFLASKGVIVEQTKDFLSIELTGIYTPGPAFAGLTSRTAEVDLSFTELGESVSVSGTLETVPEPGTIGLLSGSLAFLGCLSRKRTS